MNDCRDQGPAPTSLAALLFSVVALSGCTDAAMGDAEGSETGALTGPELLGDPEIIFHEHQPMVVDVIVELDRSASVELVHDDDEGVKVASLAIEDEGRRHHLRVRGLAPDTTHALTLTLVDAEEPAASTSAPLSVTTLYQLPGFRPSFEIELDPARAAALDPVYRLLDYANTPLWDPAGIFVIDAEGVTRWYYEGGPPEIAGATAIWAGLELLADGRVLSVRDGVITLLDELGERQLELSSVEHGLAPFHHDVRLLANGNFLTLSNSFRDVDYTSLGYGPTFVAGDLLVELDPSGEIVWTWDSFDHLDPLRIRSVPGDGLTYTDPETEQEGFDWTHGNGMIERVQDDLILVSMRHQDWLVAIDHQSGEVVWRLGPEGDFELLAGTWFFHQHSPQWQPDGSLLLYDNAIGNPDLPLAELESRAVRYVLDEDAMTATQVWDSSDGDPVVAAVAGDADRTPAGNVLITDSSLQPDPSGFDIGKNYCRVREVDPDDSAPIWSLTTKLGSFIYRAVPIERLPGEAE